MKVLNEWNEIERIKWMEIGQRMTQMQSLDAQINSGTEGKMKAREQAKELTIIVLIERG